MQSATCTSKVETDQIRLLLLLIQLVFKLTTGEETESAYMPILNECKENLLFTKLLVVWFWFYSARVDFWVCSSVQKVLCRRGGMGETVMVSVFFHIFLQQSLVYYCLYRNLLVGCIFKQQSQIKLPLSERINYVNRRRVVCNFCTGFARQGPISNVEVNKLRAAEPPSVMSR